MRSTSIALLALVAVPLAAQVTGFTPAAAAREDSIEQLLLGVPDTASARRFTHDLSVRPHMAGTPAQAATRDYVLSQLRAWGGFDSVWAQAYDVYMPQPERVEGWVLARAGAASDHLQLAEPPVPGDSSSAGPAVPPFNGYTGYGDVTAEIVYVNYGLIEDYRTLDSLGISVKGKIAVARYGRSFRGIKAREAEKHGALALVMYSDPQDDGYFRGDVYPQGPMRPPMGIQRGSILNENGDPTTPGYASTPSAHRLPEDSLDIPHIPVIPMGYGNAQRLLAALAGPSVPQPWQGGLPFRYHVGPGPTLAHLVVRGEHGAKGMHTIWDTFAMIRGATHPEQWVLVGGHRDAWSPGAADNISGTVTVMEAAHAFSELAKQGRRPARTLIFATWDAEEWGLIGSTEWVEDMADSLTAHAVAYVNEDDVTQGFDFGGSGSPSLKTLMKDAARVVPDPQGSGSVYDTWLKRNKGDSTALRFGNMGGGSDFSAFYHHLGIPAAEVGFGGPGGVYHSMYDSYNWMTRFGDPGYRAHQAVARLVSVMLARLANADVAPFDYAAFGTEMGRLVAQLDSGVAKKHWTLMTQPLKDALARFTTSAAAFATARDAALASGVGHDWTPVNAALMQVERRLTRPEGLAGRPWFRSLQFAADVDNGYATMAFPTVNEAIRYADAVTAQQELDDVVRRVDAARGAVDQATAALR